MSARRNDADGIVHRFLRLSQTLVPSGVGGILDLDGESFMACDVRHWEHPRVPGSDRLRRALRVDEICEAPHGEGGSGAPFFRFPRWLFCEQCQHMYLWPRDRDQNDGGRPVCPRCPGERWLTPMRWVAACPEGHIQDVDWQRWAHARSKKPSQRNCQSLKLKFHTIAGGGTGIDKLAITCTECGSWRSLRGLTREDALKGVGVSCEGRQPWEPETSPCAEDVLVIQRGATNLQFAKTASAIEIPPESHFDPMGDLALCVRGHGLYYTLASGQAGPIAETQARQIAEFCQTDVETVLAIARQESGGPEAASSAGSDLHEEEWLALVKEGGEPNPLDTFVTEPVLLFEEDGALNEAERLLADKADRVVIVHKLKEVRALRGFTRLEPGNSLVPPDLGKPVASRRLPGIEVFGEGVFFSFSEAKLQAWEAGAAQPLLEHLGDVQTRAEGWLLRDQFESTSARFVFLHSLAHLLIRRLAQGSGYSMASLRERIYAREPGHGEALAGILIYTASGDAEGSLGGLARYGEPPRLATALLASIADALVCAFDPVCAESRGQGYDALNLAACHGCCLLPETSCTCSDSLLDRGLVSGSLAFPHGYLSDVAAAL